MTPQINLPLPQAIDAEKGILGSILLSPANVIPICLGLGIGEKSFHHPAHVTVFNNLLEMFRDEKPIDLISLTQRLSDLNILDSVGGAVAITELFTIVPTATNVRYYIEVVSEKQVGRDLILACTTAISRAYVEQGDLTSVIIDTDAAITKINESLHRKNEITRTGLLSEYLDEKEAIATGKKQHVILSSPIDEINRRVGGYGQGELTIIMGPTNSGKSMFGMEHILAATFDYGMPSAIFTGEMPYKQYMDRIISNRARITNKKIKFAKMDQGEARRFNAVNDTLVNLPLEIFDQQRNKLTLESIEAEIRVMKKKMGLQVVLIDYLQRLNIGKRKDMRRDEELGFATVLFKSLAVELGLWIFLLSSTNDEGQVRDSRGPEYDADNIISVITNDKKVTTHIFIPKWRDGEKSYFVNVEIEGEFSHFKQSDYQQEETQNAAPKKRHNRR